MSNIEARGVILGILAGVAVEIIVGGVLTVVGAITLWVGLLMIGVGAVLLVIVLWYVFKHKPASNPLEQEARRERASLRQQYRNREEIPKMLLEIHQYVAKEVGEQKIPQDLGRTIFMDLVKTMSKQAVLLLLVYAYLPPARTVIKLDSITPRLLRDWVVALGIHDFGPAAVAKTEPYNTQYQQLLEYETGLPQLVVQKINRFLMLSNLLNSLMLLRPTQPFWNDTGISARARRFLPPFGTYLETSIDTEIGRLVAEVSEDIEQFLLGE